MFACVFKKRYFSNGRNTIGFKPFIHCIQWPVPVLCNCGLSFLFFQWCWIASFCCGSDFCVRKINALLSGGAGPKFWLLTVPSTGTMFKILSILIVQLAEGKVNSSEERCTHLLRNAEFQIIKNLVKNLSLFGEKKSCISGPKILFFNPPWLGSWCWGSYF
jgi:hypothetical protein